MNWFEYVLGLLGLHGGQAVTWTQKQWGRTVRDFQHALAISIIFGVGGYFVRFYSYATRDTASLNADNGFGLFLMIAGWLVAAFYLLIFRIRAEAFVWAAVEASKAANKLGTRPETTKSDNVVIRLITGTIRLPLSFIERVLQAIPTTSQEEARKFFSNWILKPLAWYTWLGLVITALPFYRSPLATGLILLAAAALVFALMYLKVESPWEKRFLLWTPPLVAICVAVNIFAPEATAKVRKGLYVYSHAAKMEYDKREAIREKENDIQDRMKTRISELGGKKVALMEEQLKGAAPEREQKILRELSKVDNEINSLKNWSVEPEPIKREETKSPAKDIKTETEVKEPQRPIGRQKRQRSNSVARQVADEMAKTLEELQREFPE